MRRFTTGLVLAAGAVWKLLESGRYAVAEAVIDGPVPIDVDTWAESERLLESS